ncbi:beta-taxilin-like isoform X1 [Clinocottus analis]|uniref:beta-taxilin-like isoform X1 n=1 Tax=Clinocottus analis TaxID=304258 RepID=UPI0035C02781
METSVKAAELLAAPRPDGEDPEGEAAAPPSSSSSSSSPSSSSSDLLEEFKRRLDDIISTHGSAADLLDMQSAMEVEAEKVKKEPMEDMPVAMETEVCLIMKSLKKISSPEKKLEEVVRKYAEVAALRRGDDRKLCVLQHRLCVLQEERQQLQAARRGGAVARGALEALCRELQTHYGALREETLQRRREDEDKRTEITSHFQAMLTEIQTQIQQHSTRNDKLCSENSSLTDKLEGLMSQCEMREESLEKMNRHRELQHKLTEARLQQSQAELSQAEETHKREKDYLLREAIDKTKKCFAMKEQELAMKKKLSLYAQKFDEFQATLAKSNEIYVRFKKEMDNMSEKMKKMEKESTLWRTRFENCNKALTDMMEERTEKSKEYDVFVLKIAKLERLCQALQSERVILYDKIKEIRLANANIPSKVFGDSADDGTPDPVGAASLTPVEIQEIQEFQERQDLQQIQAIQKEDRVLTEGMSRLREEQAKLQEIAASLMAEPGDALKDDGDDVDPEEDLVSSAFVQFKTKAQVQQGAEPQPDDVEEDPKPAVAAPVEAATPTHAVKVPARVQEELPPVQPQEEQQKQQVPATEPEKVQIDPPTEQKPNEVSVQTAEGKPDGPAESSKKQTPKKKKKRNGKNAS